MPHFARGVVRLVGLLAGETGGVRPRAGLLRAGAKTTVTGFFATVDFMVC